MTNHTEYSKSYKGVSATPCYDNNDYADFWKALTESGEKGVKWDGCIHKLGGSSKPWELFNSKHAYDWCPICLLTISLGTVYAFYPSIAPYSIIDFQYASVIELWILFISAIIPIALAVLDTVKFPGAGSKEYKYGPSGCLVELQLAAGDKIEVDSTNRYLKFSDQQITLNNIQVTHQNENVKADNNNYHPTGETCQASSDPTKFHNWHTNSGLNTFSVNLRQDDKYKVSQAKEITVPELKDHNDVSGSSKKPTAITYKYYFNWFMNDIPQYNLKDSSGSSNELKVKFTGKDTLGATIDTSTYSGSVKLTKNGAPFTGTPSYKDDSNYNAKYWNCVWFSAIFYILCIQIFMTLLHYPDCLLSCHCNNHPYVIVFISVLFNTVREVMQACAFAGAGKQCTNNLSDLGTTISTSGTLINKLREGIVGNEYTLSGKVKWKDDGNLTFNTGDLKLKVKPTDLASQDTSKTVTEMRADPSSSSKKIYIPSSYAWNGSPYSIPYDGSDKLFPNGTIAATNKLITLFVMMFCVFTGDGYLQHYRRCCRDCWPTTGYTKYQSFRYWLRCGFKGGSKSFRTAFTNMYHRNNSSTNHHNK